MQKLHGFRCLADLIQLNSTQGEAMIQIRKALDRGHANHGWLDTYHTFSFSAYQDPEHMKFRSLTKSAN